MAIKYISDLHLGHENVIKFDNRPFYNTTEMEETIVMNWNSAIAKDDTVYILGDFCWGKTDEWIRILSKLNGIKVLIKGNHDLKGYSSQLRKMFEDVCDYKEINDDGRRVILCHYPIPFHKAAYSENTYMLYGHVHTTREYDFLKELKSELINTYSKKGDARGNFYNVGCMLPYMNYTPRTLDEIISGEIVKK